jgi:hypothetical protein
VKRVLVTGMSGTGKSSLLHEFAARGYRTADTDYGDYFQTIDGEILWREDRVSMLLSSAPDELPGVLFVQGTTRNQVLFYPRFYHIVLLSAPPEILAERLRTSSHSPPSIGTSRTSAAGSTRPAWTAALASGGSAARTGQRTPGGRAMLLTAASAARSCPALFSKLDGLT